MELERVGFRQVEERLRTITWAWPGPPDELWEHFREVSAPFHPIMNSLSPDEWQQATSEVVAAYGRYYDGQRVNAPALIVVASGVR